MSWAAERAASAAARFGNPQRERQRGFQVLADESESAVTDDEKKELRKQSRELRDELGNPMRRLLIEKGILTPIERQSEAQIHSTMQSLMHHPSSDRIRARCEARLAALEE